MCKGSQGSGLNRLRVLRENAEKLAKVLTDNGYDAQVFDGCHTNLNNGCSDPDCCPQHVSYNDQGSWSTIKTNCSGNKAHKLWISMGLTKTYFGK